MQYVVDTSVVVAAFRSSRGASFALMTAIGRGEIGILVTTAVMLEYEAVLKRPEQRVVHGQSVDEIDDALRNLASFAGCVETYYRIRPALRDPTDEMFLEAAINGHADAIVTFNIRDFRSAIELGVRAIKPAEALSWSRR